MRGVTHRACRGIIAKKIKDYWTSKTNEMMVEFSDANAHADEVEELINWFDGGWAKERSIAVLQCIPAAALNLWKDGLSLLEDHAMTPRDGFAFGVVEFALVRVLVVIQELLSCEGSANREEVLFGDADMVLELFQELQLDANVVKEDVVHAFQVYSAFPRANLVGLKQAERMAILEWLRDGFLKESSNSTSLMEGFSLCMLQHAAFLITTWTTTKQKSQASRQTQLEQAFQRYNAKIGIASCVAIAPARQARPKQQRGPRNGRKRVQREDEGDEIGQENEATKKSKSRPQTVAAVGSRNQQPPEELRKSNRQRKPTEHFQEYMADVRGGNDDKADEDEFMEDQDEEEVDSDDYEE